MRLNYTETGAEFVENETTKQVKQQQLQTNEALPRVNIVQSLCYLLKFQQLYSELAFALIQISGELWHNRKC